MSTTYHQGRFGFLTYSEVNPKFKAIIPILNKNSAMFYLELKSNLVPTKPRFKVTGSAGREVMDQIYAKLIGMNDVKLTNVKPGAQYTVGIGGKSFIIYKSGGKLKNVYNEDGVAEQSKNPTNDQQEDAVVFLLNEAKLRDPSDIDAHIKFPFSKGWHHSFVQTFTAVDKYLKLNQYEFYRDSDKKKPKALNLMTDGKILPDAKDNWNPSDVWAVRKNMETRITPEIAKIHDGIIKKKMTVADLNDYLQMRFDKKDIVGISLKQVAAPKARGIVVKNDLGAIKSTKFKWGDKFAFRCSNSYFDINLEVEFMGLPLAYYFRFRPRGASGEINTYGEGRAHGAATWDGAISAQMINKKEPSLRKFVKLLTNMTAVPDNVNGAIQVLPKEYDKFAEYYNKKKFKTITIAQDKDSALSEYEIKRAVVLLYYIFILESMRDSDILDLFFSAKKLNSFSSVHYKVY